MKNEFLTRTTFIFAWQQQQQNAVFFALWKSDVKTGKTDGFQCGFWFRSFMNVRAVTSVTFLRLSSLWGLWRGRKDFQSPKNVLQVTAPAPPGGEVKKLCEEIDFNLQLLMFQECAICAVQFEKFEKKKREAHYTSCTLADPVRKCPKTEKLKIICCLKRKWFQLCNLCSAIQQWQI